ncbi:protein kinase domain-containing protein, partial [Haematococcus lacustris]
MWWPAWLSSTARMLCTGRLVAHTSDLDTWYLVTDLAQVADLGLGRVMGQHQTHLSNAMAGTPLYIAQEVWATGQFSKAGDVYSFGVLAWELLHGIDAWTRLQQITQEPRYLKGLEPHPLLFQHDWHPQPSAPATPQAQAAARGLRDLVDGCLQPQPSARPSFQDLEQYFSALRSLLSLLADME